MSDVAFYCFALLCFSLGLGPTQRGLVTNASPIQSSPTRNAFVSREAFLAPHAQSRQQGLIFFDFRVTRDQQFVPIKN